MRLTILALSAAAITGCSWGGGYSSHTQPGCASAYGQGYGGYTQTGYQSHGYQQFGQGGYGYAPAPGCGGGAYGFGAAGMTGNSYGFQNYGASAGHGAMGQGMVQPGMPAPVMGGQPTGFQGAAFQGSGFQGGGYQAGGFQTGSTYVASGYPSGAHAGGATTLGASAPYGSAYAGGANVKTIIGAPIYAPQPYLAPYPVPVTGGPACCGANYGGGYAAAGGAMRLGAELFAGREYDVSGDIFTKKSNGPPDGDFSIPLRVGEIDPISYKDAFGATSTIGGTLAYDHSPQTTLFASVGYSKAEGQTVENYTTVQDGTWSGGSSFTPPPGTFTPAPGSSPRSLDGQFTDLKTTTVEVGARQYSGNPHGLRGYVGVSGGFYHNNDITFTQTYSDTGAYYGQRTFVESGWNPTAAAVLGAELPVGPRAAIGAEWGVRWRDNMDTGAPSEDRISMPFALRGRLAF